MNIFYLKKQKVFFNTKNTTHKNGTLPEEVIVDGIMIDAIELATCAQEERIADARYVAKYLEEAFSTETEPATALDYA